MMDFISVPVVFGIVTWGIYKLFELFVCKRERIMLIEKIERLQEMPQLPKYGARLSFPFSALKIGCLLAGMGFGLMVGCFIYFMTQHLKVEYWMSSVIYGGCVLFFGGAGLIVAFITELKIMKNEKKDAVKAGREAGS